MASFEMSLDMVIEILSHCPASLVEKCREINIECNKRTYASSFLKLNLQRTNSISGYFLEYSDKRKVHSTFVKDLGNIPRGSEISLDFLPPGRVNIKACDTRHGVLLCVNASPVRGREPEYIVCKPTTKQYLILPEPRIQYFAIALGVMVVGTDPFRYKILRLSKLPGEDYRYNFNSTLVCEIFDSDSFTWNRLNNVEFPEKDLLAPTPRNFNPVASYGFLHWLTTSNNVFRFCFKTNSWSFFPVPEILASESSLKLARYGGKLGVISSRRKEGVEYLELWVLDSSFGNSWVNLKEIRSFGLELVGFLSNDVVTLGDTERICLYNMDTGETRNLQVRAPKFTPSFYSTMSYFPLYSDFERVEFNARSNGYEQDQ